MKTAIKRTALALIALVIAVMTSGAAFAQADTVHKKRLHSPAVVSGTIGGESHESYVIRAKKGQRMTVQISWKKGDGNKAEFKISRSNNFFGGGHVRFGRSNYSEDRWEGKVPTTGEYYIYVVAHPTAHYKLRVTVR